MKLDICNICNVCLALLYLVVVSFSFSFFSFYLNQSIREKQFYSIVTIVRVQRRSIDLSLLYLTGSGSGIGSGPREGSRSSLDHPLNVTQV